MNRIFRHFSVGLLLLVGVSVAWSAEVPAAKAPQPDRWLIIVDTSAAMERRGKAVEGVVGELLVSGMHGEMKPGSDIGIWTYNKELFAGVVPLQTWEPAKSNLIAGRTVNFLAAQKFRDKSRLALVMEELKSVVAESRRLTVLVFSDGSGSFTNTPFDEALNAAAAANQPQLAKTRMPLVTVLRSEKGKYIGHNVSLAPWPVEFPPFAPEPVAAPAPKPEPPATNRPPREIHISAKPKPEPIILAPIVTTPVITPLPEPTPTNPPPADVPTVEPARTAPPEVAAAAPAAPLPAALPVVDAPPAAPVVTPPANPPVATPAAIAEPAVILPGTGPARSRWPLYAGIGFMTTAALVALILVIRSRRSAGSSLITRSFDRQ